MLDLQIDFPPDPEKAGNSSKSINNKGDSTPLQHGLQHQRPNPFLHS